jgi:L-talarate/galactarate dehydratase
VDRISSLQIDLKQVALPRRGKLPLASAQQLGPTHVDTICLQVQTDSGRTGLGFTAHFGPGVQQLKNLLEAELLPLVLNEPAHNTDRLYAKAEHHFREVGFAGLPARAYALLDIALWDLKSQAAGVTLAEYLGGARSGCSYFQTESASTAWDPNEVAKASKTILKQGGIGVRVRLGSGDVQADADRVRELHDAVGEDAWVGVNAAGSYDLNTALALAHFFEDQGIDWFEDPIPAHDAIGYLKMSERVEIPLAVGSQLSRVEDFLRLIRDGLIRIIRPDVIALGGLTPVLRLATVAQSYQVAVSPICSMELGVHLGCGLASVPHIDSRSWLSELFTEVPSSGTGKLAPLAKPGLGLVRA